MSKASAGHPLYATDLASERVEELQLTLGEGPGVDAFALGSAVLAPDLRADGKRLRWPVFALEAVTAGAVAAFEFPLRIGGISPGVLDLYSDVPVELDSGELADAMVFADTATLVLVGARIDPRAGRSMGSVATGPRSTRPPACSPFSSAWASRRRSSACAPTPTPTDGDSPRWRPTWWPAGCGSRRIRTWIGSVPDDA